MENLDNNSTNILSFIYEADSKTVREIMNKFELHAMSRREYIFSLIAYFVDQGYAGIIIDEYQYILKHNLYAHLQKCHLEKTEPILPEYSVYLLPPGRAAVENARRNKWYFTAPFVISVVSLLISVWSLLYQVFNNAPILVDIINR